MSSTAPSSSSMAQSSSSSLGGPPATHQYPKEVQLKIYQAFIFSIPVLFSIILVLLFYLFYLKRRSSSSPPPPPVLPVTVGAAATLDCDGSKRGLKNKLRTVSSLESMKTRDGDDDPSSSLCCVCLGEFDGDDDQDKVVQVTSCCDHIFHAECIHHWLRNNATCPLCRAPIHYHHAAAEAYYNYSPHHHHHNHHHRIKTPPPPLTDQHLHHCTVMPPPSQASSSSSTVF